ncbi:hypothetical protein RclHR1_02980018 [Rhizophagus clarus]|uniref:Uncharacterized protein n=1 Tax=Rhizophagus clarus TaxID=94130 RepID=A0A2Z6RJE0_9GLOM|nr:hypothetical protein RclHR1_02980018 [Rhizophagus clarus]
MIENGIQNITTNLWFVMPDDKSFHPDTEDVHSGNIIDIHPSSHYDKHSNQYFEATTKKKFDKRPRAWTTRVFSFGRVNSTRSKFVPGVLDTGNVVAITLLIYVDTS